MKKNKRISILFSFFVVMMAIFSSCEEEVKKIEKETTDVEFLLEVQGLKQVSATRSVTDAGEQDGIVVSYPDNGAGNSGIDHEDVINNIYILQFSNSTNKLLAVKNIDSDAIKATIDSKGKTVYKVRMPLEKTDNCSLYIMANTDPSLFDSFETGSTTVDDYKSLEELLTNEDMNKIKTGDYIPMSGYYAGSLSAPDITIWLTRVVAKLTLTVTVADPATLSLTYVQLQNIPTCFTYYDDEYDSNSNYPDITADFIYYPQESMSEQTTYIWYMPENKRGMNTAITNQKDKSEENDPSWSNNTSYATRVVLKGTYNRQNITITLYPGENITNDFNIRRNTQYNMTADIRNIASDDQRIKTD